MAALRPSWAWTPHTIHRGADDEFFNEGNTLCQRYRKQFVVGVSGDEEDCLSNDDESDNFSFTCQAVGCSSVFHSVQQYECHYNSQHRYPCVECRHSFPNSHLLDVHITEWHNPMFEVLARTQNMYKCLLDTCPEKFQDYQQRKDHMIKIHKYPANFRFDKPPKHKKQTRKGSSQEPKRLEVMETEDTQRYATEKDNVMSQDDTVTPKSLSSLAYGCLSVNKHDPVRAAGQSDSVTSQSGSETAMEAEVCGGHGDASVDMKENSSCSRRFVYKKSNVPRSICFGAGSQRGFYTRGRSGKRGRHWYQSEAVNKNTGCDIEEVNMDEMATALDAAT